MRVLGLFSDHAILNARFIVGEAFEKDTELPNPRDDRGPRQLNTLYEVFLERVHDFSKAASRNDYAQCLPEIVTALERLAGAHLTGITSALKDSFFSRIRDGLAIADLQHVVGGERGLFGRLGRIEFFVMESLRKDLDRFCHGATEFEFRLLPSREEMLHRLDIARSVAGATVPRQALSEAGGLVIEIYLKVDSFCFHDYKFLPYIIAHEFLCHGCQSIRSRERRELALPYCRWTEGFVDAAALARLLAWLTKEHLEGTDFLSQDDKPLCVDFMNAAREFSRKRCEIKDKTGPWRKDGARLFVSLARALAGRDAAAAADDQAADFAIALNMEPFGEDGRRTVLEALEILEIAPSSPGAAKVLSAIRRFLRTAEAGGTPPVSEFLKELQGVTD